LKVSFKNYKTLVHICLWDKELSRRYEERFGEPPLKVDAARYPGEVDIVIYVNETTEEKQKFASEISEKLDDDGLNNIVLVRKPE